MLPGPAQGSCPATSCPDDVWIFQATVAVSREYPVFLRPVKYSCCLPLRIFRKHSKQCKIRDLIHFYGACHRQDPADLDGSAQPGNIDALLAYQSLHGNRRHCDITLDSVVTRKKNNRLHHFYRNFAEPEPGAFMLGNHYGKPAQLPDIWLLRSRLSMQQLRKCIP